MNSLPAIDFTKSVRLQIGMSRPVMIPDEALQVFFDSTWINLGDAPKQATPNAARQLSWPQKGKQFIKSVWRLLSTRYDQRCKLLEESRVLRQIRVQAMEESPFFRPFWWTVDSKLDFPDGAFSFVFSEHFFEHIWPDEAYALFQECFRILRPNGVLRISVPDADLRVYEPPEPFAFDTATLAQSTRGWLHPEVHKIRWNIYLLTLVLSLAGFRVRPIVYCDKQSRYVQEWPQKGDCDYPGNVDWDVVSSSTYLNRRNNSLIVDAIKTEPNKAPAPVVTHL
jgi:predicted SAM-dependent methyltransferase